MRKNWSPRRHPLNVKEISRRILIQHLPAIDHQKLQNSPNSFPRTGIPHLRPLWAAYSCIRGRGNRGIPSYRLPSRVRFGCLSRPIPCRRRFLPVLRQRTLRQFSPRYRQLLRWNQQSRSGKAFSRLRIRGLPISRGV